MPAPVVATSTVSLPLAPLLDNGALSDVSLEVHADEHGDGGAVEMFDVHKIILSSSSTVFTRMFIGNFDEKSQVGWLKMSSYVSIMYFLYINHRKLLLFAVSNLPYFVKC